MDKKELLGQVKRNNRDFKGVDKVIKAMEKVDRKYFVRKEDLNNIYVDHPLGIGKSQTISQPTTVARMLLMLDLKKGISVLEIGSGSGWNAALLAFSVAPGKVVSVERVKELSKFAISNFFKFAEKENIRKLRIDFIFADATNEKEEFWKNRFDRIIVTAMVGPVFLEKIKEMAIDLLKERGLLLFPFDNGLELWEKEKGEIHKLSREGGYVFVPLVKGEE